MFRRVKWLILFIIVVSSLCGCSLLTAFEDPKVAVVRKMYDSYSNGDMNAYIDTQLPENLTQPNYSGAITALSLSVGPVGLDFSKLLKVTIGNLTLKIVSSTDDYALVQAQGSIRLVAFLVQYKFCDQHDVRKVDGNWYIDANAPERTVRIQRIMNSGRFSGMDINNPSSVQSYYQQYAQNMEQMLNLCE